MNKQRNQTLTIVGGVAAVLFFIFLIISWTKVPPGYVGIVVSQTGSDKGVENNVRGTGWYFLTPVEKMYIFPTFKQNYTWTANPNEGNEADEHMTFNTGGTDNVQVDVDLGISYTIVPDKVPVLFQTYRSGIDEITHVYIKNYIRDCLNKEGVKYTLEEVLGSGKVKMFQDVRDDVNKILQPEGISVEQVYLIGHLRPPQVIVDAINAKIAAVQKAEQTKNEIKQATNQADKLREEAKGIRDSNQIKAASLTDALIRWEALQKWNGVLPQATGSGAMPFISLNERRTEK